MIANPSRRDLGQVRSAPSKWTYGARLDLSVECHERNIAPNVIYSLSTRARRVIDRAYQHVVVTEIAQGMLLARAHLTHGAGPHWGYFAVDGDLTIAAQNVK